MAAAEAFGEVGYGSHVLQPQVVKVSGAAATVRDCQDSSRTGRMKIATGEKVTVGVKNVLVTVGMKLGADGVWRVSTADYDSAGSCIGAA